MLQGFPGESTWDAGAGWLLALLLPALAYAVGEEVGWRGFLLPRLQARHHPPVAATLLGLVWVAWHIPFYLYRPGMAGTAGTEQVAQGVVIIIGGFFLAWVTVQSQGANPFAVPSPNSTDAASAHHRDEFACPV